MKITHYGHSCVLLDTGSARLLIDPGMFSAGFESLTGLDAILVTHMHPDHLDRDRITALLAANPGAALVTDPGSEPVVRDLGLDGRTVRPGELLDFSGSAVHVVGGQHAVIHPEFPVVRNCGYLVDHGAFYHPGDALFVPEQRVDVLGLPTAAPWLKSAEAIDFLRALKPRAAVPIHQAVLSTADIWYGQFRQLAPSGTDVRVLTAGESTEV